MDITNATAAGPSRGLLDVLFGSQGPEEAEADGQGFGNLMNLIKALNGKKEAEEQGADASRTLRETLAGKDVADGSAIAVPGMKYSSAVASSDENQLTLMQGMQDQEQKERLSRLSLLGSPAAMMMQQQPVTIPVLPPEMLEGVSPEQVNEVLRQKSLPPLSQEETKLLQEVNGRIAEANRQAGEGVELPPEILAGGAAVNLADLDPVKAKAIPKAAVPAGQALDPQMQKALAAKGVDPRKLKAAEISASPASGTPEKILPTETYLQLHGNANAGANAKAQAKELAGKGPQVTGAEQSAAARGVEGALTAAAVAGAAQKGPELGSRKGDESEKLTDGAKQTKLDALAGSGFGSALAQKSEVASRDVYLQAGQKPEQIKSALVAELGTGVAFHANKGGGEMRLVIHPDDMGEVRLKVGTKNGKVEVQVTAENENVAKMLRGGSSDLEASLKSQNLSLAKFEVSVTDGTTVVSTDTKSGLNEQFLGQNQQHSSGGFSQASSDEGRNSRWGTDQGGRQGGGYSALAEESGRGSARSAQFVPKIPSRAMDSSRRLDVVA